jgi:DamX protein
MPNIPGAGDLTDPFAPDLPLFQRLRALESPDAEPVTWPEQDARMQAFAIRVQALADDLAAHRTQMRDQEKALVERIADVDDDRRLAIAHLQRGWQTQRDDIAARLRGPGWLAAAALMLALALGVGMAALYFDARATRATLVTAIERLTAEQQRLAAELELRGQAGDAAPMARQTGPEPAVTADLAAPTTPAAPVEATPPTTPADPAAPAAPAPAPAPDPAAAPPVDSGATAAPEALPLVVVSAMADKPVESGATVRITGRPFALQLVGSHYRERLMELTDRADLPEFVYLHQETRRGRPWFVLIHSLHGSVEEAQEALAQLPAALRAPLPWVRALAPETSLDRISTRASAE